MTSGETSGNRADASSALAQLSTQQTPGASLINKERFSRTVRSSSTMATRIFIIQWDHLISQPGGWLNFPGLNPRERYAKSDYRPALDSGNALESSTDLLEAGLHILHAVPT